VAEFCTGLRVLQESSGMDRATLARRLKADGHPVGKSQLYAILGGQVKRPPDWTAVVRPLVLACAGGDQAALSRWRRRYDVMVGVYEELARRDRHPAGTVPVPVPSGPAAAPGSRSIRALRADTAAFTGRAGPLSQIRHHGHGGPGRASVCVIDGMPGVGKTALAVHAGHLLADGYPDGQLFADLHAFTPGRNPADPTAVLASLLRMAGVPPDQIPDGDEERSARWRDWMAGRRMLLILDDAAASQQVAPLLPGSPGCLVLVTSRRRLPALSRDYGAAAVPLGVLPEDDAIALFGLVAGRSPGSTGAGAVAGLVRLCGYLPLAITILAAALTPHPGADVAALVAELETAQDRLAGIDAALGEQELGVAAAFDLSYGGLATHYQRTLRLLAATPGTDLDAWAAAALTALPVETARQHLAGLHAHRLAEQAGHGRFRLHDLIRAYARHRSARTESEPAIGRLLDYYQHTAAQAQRHLTRYPRPDPAGPAPATGAPAFGAQPEAASWLRTERSNLLACLDDARQRQQTGRVAGLAASLSGLLLLDGPWGQGIVLQRQALAGCQSVGDVAGAAAALAELGSLYVRTGDYEQAARVLDEARSSYQHAGDQRGEAAALRERGALARITADYPAAVQMQQQALAAFQDLGDQTGQAQTLSELGVLARLTGDCVAARPLLEQSLGLRCLLGDRRGEVYTRSELGTLCRLTGDYAEAAALLEQAIALSRDLGHRYGEGHALSELAAVARDTGDYPRAAGLLDQAGDIYRDLGDRLGETYVVADSGMLHRRAGDAAEAVSLLERALASLTDLHDRYGLAYVLAELGAVRQAAGDHRQAARLLDEALTLFRVLGDRNGEVEALTLRATASLAAGHPQQARSEFQEALAIATSVSNPLQQARALAGAGRSGQALGLRTVGAELATAQEIFARIGAAEATAVTR
jgi:tetratricopeptide (TPR) repeat protein